MSLMNTPALFGYVRAMTFDPSMAIQCKALLEAGCQEIVQEGLITGRGVRPELERSLSRLEPGSRLVVWRLDCLARSLRELLVLIARLADQDVSLVSLSEGIETHSSDGRAMLHAFLALNDFEHNCHQERGTLRRAAARQRGRTGARNRKLSESEVKELLEHLRDPRVVVSELARRYGVSRSTVYAYARAQSGE